jgi:hypothetical protein
MNRRAFIRSALLGALALAASTTTVLARTTTSFYSANKLPWNGDGSLNTPFSLPPGRYSITEVERLPRGFVVLENCVFDFFGKGRMEFVGVACSDRCIFLDHRHQSLRQKLFGGQEATLVCSP